MSRKIQLASSITFTPPPDGIGPNLYECLTAESAPDPDTRVRPLDLKRLEHWFQSGSLIKIISSKVPTTKLLNEWLDDRDQDQSLFSLLLKFGYVTGFSEDILTPKVLGMATKAGWTGLHMIALSCTLKHLPTSAFTEKGLRMRTKSGRTVFHVAANQGCLEHIPQQFLTRQNLLLQDKEGLTIFHELANASKWHQIPHGIIHFKDLFSKYKPRSSNMWMTPVHLAVCHGSLAQLLTNQPARFWTSLSSRKKRQIKTEINLALQRPVWFQSPERETQSKLLQSVLKYKPMAVPFTTLRQVNPEQFISLVTEALIQPTVLSAQRSVTSSTTQIAHLSRAYPVLDGIQKWVDHPYSPSHVRQHRLEIVNSLKILIQLSEQQAAKGTPALANKLRAISQEQALFSVYKSECMHHTGTFKHLARHWPLFSKCLDIYKKAYTTHTWAHPETVTWFYVLVALRAVAPSPAP